MPRDSGHLSSAADEIRSRRVSAVELVSACVEAAQRSQDRINAFTRILGDEALWGARRIDDALARGDDPGPLAGVPIVVKDLIDQAGIPTTSGSSFPVAPATTTAPAIARLEAAGAIVIGRTGLHEFAFGFSSENHWFGPVRNPWDPATSPGGSSGGSAAAVAAGVVAAALGTDTGGSVRVPAALCGVVGLKVSHGRVPLTGVFPLAPSFDTVGPIAASVADAGLLYETMAGHDPADPWSLPAPRRGVPDARAVAGVRFGIPRPWVDRPVDPDVASAWRHFLAAVSDAGAEIVEFTLPEFEFPGLVTEAMYPEVAAIHRKRFAVAPERYGDEVRSRIALTLDADMNGYLEGMAWRRRMREAAVAAMQTCDVLVTPSVAAMRKVIGVDTIDIGGAQVNYRGALSCFSSLVNQTGLPALSMPVAMPGSPPPSIQVIGPMWSEAELLGLGLGLEAAGIVAVATPPETLHPA